MTDQNDDRSGTGSDEVLKALDELEAVLRENAESERLLSKRIAEVRLARRTGGSGRPSSATRTSPGTVQLVSTILRRQSEASGYLRRSLVVALRAEGQSIPSIAHLFGVTHQRVSNLLRRVAQGNAAAAAAATGDSDLGGSGAPRRSTASASVMTAATMSATGRQRLDHAHHLTGRQHADVGASLDQRGLRHDRRVGRHDDLGPRELVALLHGAPLAQQRGRALAPVSWRKR